MNPGALVPILLFALVACSAPPPPKPTAPTTPSQASLTLADLAPTPEETAWRDARLTSKSPLRTATIHVAGSFEESPEGKRSGFDYEMALEFARVLGLKLEVTVPEDLRLFFSRDGTIPADVDTNLALSYTPDLLKTVDLYIGPFTVLPWRERLMTMVAMYPMQNFLAGRKGEEIRSVSDLNGKRLAVLKDSMQDNLLHKLAADKNLRLNFLYIKPEADQFAVVADGGADYTLDGGLFFAQNRLKMKGLSLSSFPSDPVRVGWAMKKSDAPLASLLSKFIDRIQAQGSFSQWFETAFGTTFADYLSVLATSGGPIP